MIVRNPKALGAFIRGTRSQKRLTQSELAERVGVSRKWISEVESGKSSVDFSLILRTLTVLGVDMDLRPIPQPRELDELDAVIERTRLKGR